MKIYCIFAKFYSCKFTTTNDGKDPGEKGEEEDRTGWLWEKVWENCTVAWQVHVHTSCGSIIAGVYYNASILTKLQSCNASYTVVNPGPGRKSYCDDGWTPWCSEDDCR